MVNTRKIGRPLVIKTVVLIILASNLCAFSYDFAGGTGEPNNPYRIATAEQLLSIGGDPNLLNKNFILINDIDLDPNLPGGQIFNNSLIAFDTNDADDFWQGTPFSGCFDGNNHKIKNLVINASDKCFIGIFGNITEGEVKKLECLNFYLSGYSGVGGISGVSSSAIITSCYTQGKIEGQGYSGGLTGASFWDNIMSCGTVINIFNTGFTGGLIGNCSDSTIEKCYSKGVINGLYFIGGFIGSNNSGSISNCYADCYVSGENGDVGGFIGRNLQGNIVNCYSVCPISFIQPYGGGFIGSNYSGSIQSSFWDIERSGTMDGVGNRTPDPAGVFGKTTEQMKTASTFSAWDFANTWAICEGTNYPRLQWQIPKADLLCPDGVDFIDYAFFAERWLEEDCSGLNNNCEGCDFNISGAVDSNDLGELTNDWLGPF